MITKSMIILDKIREIPINHLMNERGKFGNEFLLAQVVVTINKMW